MDIIHDSRSVTKVIVGSPPSTSEEWKTFDFEFHNYVNLPSKKGNKITSLVVEFGGCSWFLYLYPIGDPSTDDGVVSVYLMCNFVIA